jgi:hypothetical protein
MTKTPPKLRFTKPLKDDPESYVDSEKVVRWGSYFGDDRNPNWVYVITQDCRAYHIKGGEVSMIGRSLLRTELVAEYRSPRKPQDSSVRGASWGTHPAKQRSYTRLMELCRKDWKSRSSAILEDSGRKSL